MAAQEINGLCKTANDNDIIFKSPFFQMAAGLKIPDISLTDFLFKYLEINYEQIKNKDWIVDVIKGTSYKFYDLKPLSIKFASALIRMGFKKGDILYFVTYDMALIYIVQIGTWLCGGGVRGCFQKEDKEMFHSQINETSAQFVLCDPETAPAVKWAVEQLDWPVQLLSIGGEVEGAISVEEIIQNDDCSGYPNGVKINPSEDILSIPNTSGSTGVPKGAVHTHRNLVSLVISLGIPANLEEQIIMEKTMLTPMGNYAVGSLINICLSVIFGVTVYGISKFDPKTFLKYILKYKPEALFIYPHVANWLARAPESDMYDFSFIKRVGVGGAVFDLATCKILLARLPHVRLTQTFGMSECLLVTTTLVGTMTNSKVNEEETVAGLKFKKLDNVFHPSVGVLLPLVEAKIMDPNEGCTVGPDIKGNLWLRTPYIMKGYITKNESQGCVSEVDEDGWFDTGDIAFFDHAGHLYMLERVSCIFKYYMHQVSPAEIEAVVGEHPAVLSVGVIGIPDPLTTSAARAYVVLKPGFQASEEEIKQYVAERKIFYKHLHGGVEFVDSLPENQGGKLDRSALLQKALANPK